MMLVVVVVTDDADDSKGTKIRTSCPSRLPHPTDRNCQRAHWRDHKIECIVFAAKKFLQELERLNGNVCDSGQWCFDAIDHLQATKKLPSNATIRDQQRLLSLIRVVYKVIV